MSYLNSILASIGSDEQPSQSTATAPAISRAPQPVRPTIATASTSTQSVQPPKRKAEGELNNGPPAKAPRSLTPTIRQNGASAAPTAASPGAGGFYRGTARPETVKSTPKPLQKPQPTSRPTTPGIKAEPRPSAPAAPSSTPTATGPAPKKGSYQEILARAKAAQQAKLPVGTIKHKQTEKLSKKERLATIETTKGKTPAIKDKKGERSRTGSAEASSKKSGEPIKKERKPLDLGYKGTMRPVSAEPQYKGTLGLARPGQPRKPAGKERARYDGYADWDDLDDEDEGLEEEEEGYGSDGSSDMEAGAFDLDREEEMALKMARKEDAEALAEENRLKREKEERRRRLAKMAANAGKKKPIY